MNSYLHQNMEYSAPEALLFDLDGTLYRGNERIAGADRLIAGLQAREVPCLFVTNNSTRTRMEVAHHLEWLGITAKEEAIVTSALAAAYYVQKQHPGADTYMIGENGLRAALIEAGLNLLEEHEHDKRAEIVVQGLDRKLTYDRIAFAVKHLLDGAVFVQTNPDRLLPVDGGFLPGAGSVGAILQAATNIEPVVIGKPSTILMDYALQISGTVPARSWVIGDNPYTDLAAARNVGCPSILVLTGLCTADNWQQHCAAAEVMPDAVCEGPEQLERLLDQMLNSES